MKTHPAREQGRHPGPAPGSGAPSRLAWFLLIACAAFCLGQRATAQSFTPLIDKASPAEDNASFPDHEGDYPAYIVIKNAGVVTASLSNYALTDDPSVPRKWIFPSPAGGIPLAENQTLVVFASAKNRLTPPYATNFLLPCGSTVYLTSPQGNIISQKLVEGSTCRGCTPYFNTDTLARWTVPTASFPSSDWKLPTHNDGQWSRGGRCMGYDTDPVTNGMILYAAFDTADVVNTSTTRTIADISGPVLHTGSWPASAFSPNIAIPVTNPAQIRQSVGFTGPSNPSSYAFWNHHAELDPGTANYSFSIWVRPTNTDPSGNEVIFRKGAQSTTSPGYVLTRNQFNGGAFSIVHAGGVLTTSFTNQLTQLQWTHLMVVLDRTSTTPRVLIYRNGTQVASNNIAAGISVAGPNQQLVLAQGNGQLIMFTGQMDDFITWNRALSPTEVTQVYNAGLAGQRVIDAAGGGTGGMYSSLIQTNVQTDMKGKNTSLYERIPFNVTNLSTISAVRLKVHYDDGFVAWINGTEVARRNAPSTALTFNSAAASDRADNLALTAEEIDITAAAIPAMVNGTANILAIQALNASVSDDRFLICPDLCFETARPEDCFVTTNGRDFWICFPGNFPDETTNPLRLSVTITGTAGTAGNVSIPGLSPPFSQNFVLPAGGKLDMNLPKGATLDKSDTIENKAVHIIANQNVAVYGRTRIDYSTDTFLAHPIKCLGSEYLIMGWGNSFPNAPELNGTQFAIVGTADNTHVAIKPKSTTGSHPAGVVYNLILNRGQTYLLRNLITPADLTGTEIISDSPVAVFGGHRAANIQGTTFFSDTVLEQQLPVAFWTAEYCTAPFMTRLAPGDTIRVLGSQNTTNLFRNGIAIGSVNRGEFRDVQTTAGAVITGSKPILAAHFSNSTDADHVANSDPFQINAQPTNSWLTGYKFATPVASEFGGNFCNVIARAADIAGVAFVPAAALGPVIAINATYSYRQVTLSANTTYAVSAGGRPFGLEIYGYDPQDSYGHTGGMGFSDRMPPTFTQCPPDVTIFTTNVPGAGERATLPNFGSQFGVVDNCCPTQAIIINQTPPPGTVLAPGNYQVVITATDCVENRVVCATTVHVLTDPRAAAFPGSYGDPAQEATVWGWTADPDKDGLSNEDEYATGTDMSKPSAVGDAFSFRRVMRDGRMVLEITFRRRAADPSLDYILEGGGDSEGWFSGLGHFENVSEVPDALAGFNRVTAWSVDSGDNDRFFVRLRFRRN